MHHCGEGAFNPRRRLYARFFRIGLRCSATSGSASRPGADSLSNPRLRFLNERGREKFSVSYPEVRKLFDGKHFNFMRGELELVLLGKIRDSVDVRYATTVDSFEQDESGVSAVLSNGSTIRADLLFGADGIHSKVRALAWGEEQLFTRFLGCNTAAFLIAHPPSQIRYSDTFDTLTIPGRHVAVYPIRDGMLATFFIHTAQNPPSPRVAAIDELRRVYGDIGWIIHELLDCAPPEILFDAVSPDRGPAMVLCPGCADRRCCVVRVANRWTRCVSRNGWLMLVG